MSAAPKAPRGLPRARRIKQGRDFARARAEGRRLVQGCLIVLVARHSIAGRSFSEVERDFLAALQRAGIFRAPAGPD